MFVNVSFDLSVFHAVGSIYFSRSVTVEQDIISRKVVVVGLDIRTVFFAASGGFVAGNVKVIHNGGIFVDESYNRFAGSVGYRVGNYRITTRNAFEFGSKTEPVEFKRAVRRYENVGVIALHREVVLVFYGKNDIIESLAFGGKSVYLTARERTSVFLYRTFVYDVFFTLFGSLYRISRAALAVESNGFGSRAVRSVLITNAYRIRRGSKRNESFIGFVEFKVF